MSLLCKAIIQTTDRQTDKQKWPLNLAVHMYMQSKPYIITRPVSFALVYTVNTSKDWDGSVDYCDDTHFNFSDVSWMQPPITINPGVQCLSVVITEAAYCLLFIIEIAHEHMATIQADLDRRKNTLMSIYANFYHIAWALWEKVWLIIISCSSSMESYGWLVTLICQLYVIQHYISYKISITIPT